MEFNFHYLPYPALHAQHSQNNKRACVCTSDLLRKVLESCSASTPLVALGPTLCQPAREAENVLLILDGQASSYKSWVFLIKKNTHSQ